MPPRCLLRTSLCTSLCLGLAAPLVACSSEPDPAALPDAAVAPADAPAGCPAPSGAGTTHATWPAADETWTAEGSPHLVTSNLTIAAGITLTIAPCARVELMPATSVLVVGTLRAEGTASAPIFFERADPVLPWGTIEAREGARVQLAYVDLTHGGADGGPMLDIRGDQEMAPQPILRVDHVAVRDAGAIGVVVREGAGFAPASSDLTITGASSFPLSIWGRSAGSVPIGAYTGNGTDAILLPAIGGLDNIQEDTTIADRGVPYRVGTASNSLLGVRGPGAPVLTVAAGVTLQFVDGARLLVDARTSGLGGALVVAGTAAVPVTFTSASATPAAGRWVGLVLLGAQDPRNAITHARIAYAGGESQISSYDCPSPANPGFANNGAVVIAGGQPAGAFITSTTIEASAGDGVVRGWTGAVIDLMPTNTFTSVARCHQTYPRPTSGSCPAPAPCPQ